MGHGEAEIIAGDAVPGQEEKHQSHVHGVGDDTVPGAGGLLAQSLGHGIGDEVAVKHGHQQGKAFQINIEK